MPAPKLTPDSLLTTEEQARLYREAMGTEAADRQERARRLELGRCTCEPQKVRRRWADDDTPRTRTVHAADCPKRAAWMSG